MIASRMGVALFGTLSFTVSAVAFNDVAYSVTQFGTREDARASRVEMNGASERPQPVETHATGIAEFTDTGGPSIAYTVRVRDLSSPATVVHIHGPSDAGSASGMIAMLYPIDTTVTDGVLVRGVIELKEPTAVTMDSLRALIRTGQAYVNVHTRKHPKGEIRGQFASRFSLK